MSDLAEMVDKFTRNEVFTSNEMRQFMGQKPSKDPKADRLINSNMPQTPELSAPVNTDETITVEQVDDPFAGINEVLDETFKELGVAE